MMAVEAHKVILVAGNFTPETITVGSGLCRLSTCTRSDIARGPRWRGAAQENQQHKPCIVATATCQSW